MFGDIRLFLGASSGGNNAFERKNMCQPTYELRIIRQPHFGAQTTEEQAAQNTGLPIVPVPIIQVIRRINGEEVPLELAEAMRLFLTPHAVRVAEDGRLVEAPNQGLRFEPTSPIMDTQPEIADDQGRWLFVFGDIGIRDLGRYQIRFTLWQAGQDSSDLLAQVSTETFPVVERDDWPLHNDWDTPLSARLARDHPFARIYRPPF
ncbi:uncharacterized protein PGTG_03818 [Puccinia graminis f. sp. tritici CRL 75-36-700-3]|uniref:Velvet domain-containing protein n=2 Tax=Puccinia graminis f. sp. tritici TaxID=56615 RepID=E3K0N7_PUCGT|nr:uncharacterized protein PGTG_03818 [Puccinia graminis f. sp. tritici CRL 75-36-700-3]EFP77862.2 hypothetical protein PGTG_03818 [Puccinia graminis f. sp. tritici CRL 75-36-700-3]